MTIPLQSPRFALYNLSFIITVVKTHAPTFATYGYPYSSAYIAITRKSCSIDWNAFSIAFFIDSSSYLVARAIFLSIKSCSFDMVIDVS